MVKTLFFIGIFAFCCQPNAQASQCWRCNAGPSGTSVSGGYSSYFSDLQKCKDENISLCAKLYPAHARSCVLKKVKEEVCSYEPVASVPGNGGGLSRYSCTATDGLVYYSGNGNSREEAEGNALLNCGSGDTLRSCGLVSCR